MAGRYASACRASVLLTAGTLITNALATTGDIASWSGLRGAQIRSIIALEGGVLTNGTFDGGQWQNTAVLPHPNGLYYQIDLTKSFDMTNKSAFDVLVAGPEENSDTHAPIYIGGGMLNNDYQWYTFGGEADQVPIGISVNQGNVFPSSPSQTIFTQGVSPFNNHNAISTGVSDNITAGAYASSPDTNQPLGWYFSGMVSGNRTELRYPSSDTSPDHPTVASNTFIEVDMTDQTAAKFTNLAWPSWLAPRGEAGLVWLPFGSKGVLVAIGGSNLPRDLFTKRPSGESNNTFMTDLAIYDIAGAVWYNQSTKETGTRPTEMASFCTVVVPTQDGKSQEIFVYGGYDGTYQSTNPIYDNVWVLSVPAFQWTLVQQAAVDSTHGRQGSVCFSPNPTTLITVGGSDELGNSLNSETIIDVLDLNTLKWTHQFNASSTAAFVAPSAIVTQLGWQNGSGPGTAQVSNLNDSALNTLFSTSYPGTVRTYFPYGSTSNSTGNSTGSSTSNSNKSATSNKWKIPVIATLCTVIPILLIALLAFCCIRRRRRSARDTNSSRKSVFSWLSKSDPRTEKSETSDGTAVDSTGEYNVENKRHSQIHEVPSNAIVPGRDAPMASSNPGGNQTHEIYTHPPRDGGSSRTSGSVHNPMYYPQSLAGERTMPASSGNTSRFSEGLSSSPPQRYELPQKKSNDKIIGGGGMGEVGARRSNTASSGPVSSTSGTVEPSIPRRSIDQHLGHNRDPSGLSDVAPSPRSPVAGENQPMSRAFDETPISPASPVRTRDAAEGGLPVQRFR